MLSLEFTIFDVENDKKCEFDYLEILDKNKNHLMERKCGSSLPDSITTTTNIVDLVFVSDKSIQKTGWNVTWTAVKQGESPIYLVLHCLFICASISYWRAGGKVS